MTDLVWKRENSDHMIYHYARLSSAEEEDQQAAIDVWWKKLLDLAEKVKDWNVIVGDIWVETGRIIGHVQNDDAAIGMDRGFRVALSFSSVVEALEKADFAGEAYTEASAQLYALLDRSTKREPARQRLAQLNKNHPFKLWWCENGQLDAEADTPA